MTQAHWKHLLERLQIDSDRNDIKPVDQLSLSKFESTSGLKLPFSFRSYCRVFGAGQIGNLFNIAVPGYSGGSLTYSVEYLSKSQIDLAYQFAELGVDAAQIKRSIFFSLDIIGSNHFFDPLEITNSIKNEYAVFTLFRSCEVQRSAENFQEFLTEYCLGNKCSSLIKDIRIPDQVFRPVS
ncbi:SMI1/KNR4 family protein [Gimesia sp.]|uniref:SMI1/KNR4 family protein n=1 Tax=Gimesia sp. TaxID=2024833 RepID=UPI003A8D45B0